MSLARAVRLGRNVRQRIAHGADGVGSRAAEGDFDMTAVRILAILAALAISAYVALMTAPAGA